MAHAVPGTAGERRGQPGTRGALRSALAAIALPRLRSPAPALGEYPAGELSVPARPLQRLRRPDLAPLPAHRADHRRAFGRRCLAFRLRPGSTGGAGADLGAARAERDRPGAADP